jgi:hypothetical protein
MCCKKIVSRRNNYDPSAGVLQIRERPFKENSSLA